MRRGPKNKCLEKNLAGGGGELALTKDRGAFQRQGGKKQTPKGKRPGHVALGGKEKKGGGHVLDEKPQASKSPFRLSDGNASTSSRRGPGRGNEERKPPDIAVREESPRAESPNRGGKKKYLKKETVRY